MLDIIISIFLTIFVIGFVSLQFLSIPGSLVIAFIFVVAAQVLLIKWTEA